MDPDVTWARAVAIAEGLAEAENWEAGEVGAEDAICLAELVIALGEWIGKGGFPPRCFLHAAAGTEGGAS